MEQQKNHKAPATLLPGVLAHLGLGHSSSTSAIRVEALLAMLNDADWHIRTRAITELAEHATFVPLDVFLTAFHDEDISVRAAAVRTLGRKGLLALPYISEALDDRAWLVREAAVITLGELGKQTSTEKLLASLADENEFVREAASMMLEQNRVFLPGDAEDDDAGENVVITDLDPSAHASHSRRFATFRLQPPRLAAIGLHHAASKLQPRRLATVALTGLVVAVLMIAWLALIPAIRSSQSAHGNLPSFPDKVLYSAHYQSGAYLPQWTPDGKHMAYVDDYGNLYVWDTSTKKLSKTFSLSSHPDPDAMANWAWTSDGRHIISFDYTTAIQPAPFGSGTNIQLWDALTGQRVVSIATSTFVWADNGIDIAIAGQDNVIHIFNMDMGGQAVFTISSEHFKKLSTISWSPNGQLIATSSLDGTVEIWDSANGKRLSSFFDPGIAVQKAGNITSLFTTWSPDSTRILTQRFESNSAYKSLQIWDAFTGHKLLTFSTHTSIPDMVSWFKDGQRILSVSGNEALIWEAATGHILVRIPRNDPNAYNLPILSPDERLFALTDGGPTIQLWDTSTGQKIFTYRGHTANVISGLTSLTWSPDGASISSVDTDGNILVWQVATGKLLFKYKLDLSLPSHFIPNHLVFLEWSPDGKMLAIASDEGTIAVLQGN